MEHGPSPLAHPKHVLEAIAAASGVEALGRGLLTYYEPGSQCAQPLCVTHEANGHRDVDKDQQDVDDLARRAQALLAPAADDGEPAGPPPRGRPTATKSPGAPPSRAGSNLPPDDRGHVHSRRQGRVPAEPVAAPTRQGTTTDPEMADGSYVVVRGDTPGPRAQWFASTLLGEPLLPHPQAGAVFGPVRDVQFRGGMVRSARWRS